MRLVLGKQKTCFYWLTVGKNKCFVWWEKPLERWEVRTGGLNKVSEAFLFFYYICRMNIVDVIGLISSILGILSFFGIGISISNLLKKNLFLSMHTLPYGLDKVLYSQKKYF